LLLLAASLFKHNGLKLIVFNNLNELNFSTN